MNIHILISPEAKAAYFADYRQVAEAELNYLFPSQDWRPLAIGPFDFFVGEIAAAELGPLLQLSFVQGVFQQTEQGLQPLAERADWQLHDDFVFGSKFKGKTNERLTQLLINLALATRQTPAAPRLKLLDPLAGRATTLLWAMRYGIDSFGIEQDEKAFADVQQIIKKWCKLRRQKHRLATSKMGHLSKKNQQPLLTFSTAAAECRFIIGDTRNAAELVSSKVDLLVADLPYGIQHSTADGRRNPLALLTESLPSWLTTLKKGGALALAFNNYLPARKQLVALLQDSFELIDVALAHRMSESIVRDIIVARKR